MLKDALIFCKESIFRTINFFKPTMFKINYVLLVVGKFQKQKTDSQSIFNNKFEFLVKISKQLGIRKSILQTSEAHQNFHLIPKWPKLWNLNLYLHLKRLSLGPDETKFLSCTQGACISKSVLLHIMLVAKVLFLISMEVTTPPSIKVSVLES